MTTPTAAPTLHKAEWVATHSPMWHSEIVSETVALLNRHGLGGERHERYRADLRRKMEANRLVLAVNKRTAALLVHTEMDQGEADERFEAQVKHILTDASFADWDADLLYASYQVVWNACFASWSNMRTQAENLSRLEQEGKALAREKGSMHYDEACHAEDELDRLRAKWRRARCQHDFWEWKHAAACEAYRRWLGSADPLDADQLWWEQLPSEWTPPASKGKSKGYRPRR